MRPLVFKLVPWEFFENAEISMKIGKNRRKSQIRYLDKGVLEFCRAATIKPRRTERSGFILLDHNGQTWIYRVVSGQSDAWLWRNRDFPTEDDILEKCAVKFCFYRG